MCYCYLGCCEALVYFALNFLKAAAPETSLEICRRVIWFSSHDQSLGLAAHFSSIALHAVSQVLHVSQRVKNEIPAHLARLHTVTIAHTRHE